MADSRKISPGHMTKVTHPIDIRTYDARWESTLNIGMKVNNAGFTFDLRLVHGDRKVIVKSFPYGHRTMACGHRAIFLYRRLYDEKLYKISKIVSP